MISEERRLIEAALRQVAGGSGDWTELGAFDGIDSERPEGVTLPATSNAPASVGSKASRFTAGALLGPYTLCEFQGRGAYGEVWRAERSGALATTILAVKILTDPATPIEHVRKEAEAWIRAGQHPNVLSLFEADVHDGQLVFVSEFAADGSLDQWLSRNGGAAPCLADALEMMMAVLGGLEHLHVRGILHCDLKPANILMQGPFPRIADFGLARFPHSEGGSTTAAAGTPAYMAPEAFSGLLSPQSDLWSAGVVLFRLLTGCLPFQKTTMSALINQIRETSPAWPHGVPENVRQVVDRALSKRPQERFRSAADMRSALRECLRTADLPGGTAPLPRRGCRTIAVTGSMDADPRRCLARLNDIAAPFLRSDSTWYCGTVGGADDSAIAFLGEHQQRVIAIGYDAHDLSEAVRQRLQQYGAPFVDAQDEPVPDDSAAPSRRDLFLAAKSDLVIVLWNGRSTGTKELLEWLRKCRKDHVLAFV